MYLQTLNLSYFKNKLKVICVKLCMLHKAFMEPQNREVALNETEHCTPMHHYFFAWPSH